MAASIRKRVLVLYLAVFVLVCLVCASARAHYMWIYVMDYAPDPGQKISLSLGWGHLFPGTDVMKNEDLEEIYAIGPSGKKLKVTPEPEQGKFRIEAPGDLPGAYLIIAKRKGGYKTKTTEGYKSLPKKDLKNVISSAYREMNAKAIVIVGRSGKDTHLQEEIGFPLEIVPTEIPTDMREGDSLSVKVLFRGKPHRGFVHATYTGFTADEDTFAYAAKTNKDGIAKIKLLKSGIWMVKAEHTTPPSDPELCDEHLFVSTLTFEVKR
ncbi:MAG: DUF4198 domain-containing protein [bacterium]